MRRSLFLFYLLLKIDIIQKNIKANINTDAISIYVPPFSN